MPAASSAHSDIELRNRCERWLSGHRPWRSMRESLQALLEVPESAQPLDVYGEGAVIQALETEVSRMLGKPLGSFFHKGMACQLAALKVWCGEATQGPVAMHPQSHIAIDECEAFEHLLGLRGLFVGAPDTPITLADLQALAEKPAVLVIELPLRRAGFRLPAWEELVAISAWCRANQVKLHFDGARLWESVPCLGHSLAEISALADSVYVSFYKGMGALAGSLLAGPESFMAEIQPWKTRLAGNVYTLYPLVLSSWAGLRRQLPRMAGYRERAQALALQLLREPTWLVAPSVPQTNSFQLHLPVDPARLRLAMLALAEAQGFWLGARTAASQILPDGAMVEIVIGDAADDWSDAEAVAAWRHALALARA
ncbi:threonine aldolase [Paucibacter sp. KBW04]|uniref:threonine aldolase family protein n=1 Tax=Paucibacter sp. KBW04 TaxID=2153361 RepID=UPI000F565983|nr:beta-eliminating lyase-related protein [Paucibacter sp. KBW04]RQO54706.1 threonine aldolase [Paucibacter sp. KBW04]